VINGLLTVGAFYFADLYKMDSIIRPRRRYSRIVLRCAVIFLALIACGFAFKISNMFSRIWLFSWFFSSVIAIGLSRVLIRRFLLSQVRARRLTRNLAIVGADRLGARLVELLNKQNDSWFQIVGIYDDRSTRIPRELGGHPLSGDVDDLV
ncbi:MAG: hypothetical protein ACREX4_13785, partial [Gammaproteobacteria bacterium]